jgi:methylmalonyl-CoA mutase cobalamin-binding subunit
LDFYQRDRSISTANLPWSGSLGPNELAPHEAAEIDGPIPASEIHRLALASLESAEATNQCASTWLQLGGFIDDIYLHGITGAARLLGAWWLSDRIAFSDVTVGSARLHRLLYDFSPVFLANCEPQQEATVLLWPEPGSQHTMGVFMLSEFFRRAGWHTLLEHPDHSLDPLRTIATNWIDLVALSVGSDRQFEGLRTLVANIRQTSPNSNIRILAGGPMALTHAQALRDLGVDWVGTDARTTVMQATREWKAAVN